MYTYQELREIVEINRKNRKRIKEALKIYKVYPIFSIFLSIMICIGLIGYLIYAIAEYNIYDLSNKNEIGDAFGGIANPIIAFFGVIVTFLAFYIQYRFNKEQSARIDQEIKERKEEKKQSKREVHFNYLSSEFLRIEKKVLDFNDTSFDFGNKETSNTRKFDFQKIINEMTYILSIVNNLIRLADLKRVDNYKSKNAFIDEYDQIILSNIYFLHKSIFENCIEHFVIILSKARLLNYMDDSDRNIINYKNEREELEISIGIIEDLLFTVYPNFNLN